MKITKLFVGGTLNGLTYEWTISYNEVDFAKYTKFVESGFRFNTFGFGGPFKIVSVEVL